MSTLGSPAANWREEVNRRLAEHKSRKGNASAANVPAQPVAPGNSRAAQAAARVAARFAKAPTYNQFQAEEARMAVRAAEIATQVAREAQTEAESRLAELNAATVEPAEPAELIPFENAAAKQGAAEVAPETAAQAEWDWHAEQAAAEPVAAVAEPVVEAVPVVAAQVEEPVVEAPAGPVTDARTSSGQVLQIRWEPDMPGLSGKAEAESDPFELEVEDWWTPAEPVGNHEEPVHVEAHAIQANLIEFPRELVATRRMRPRLLEEMASQSEAGTQLSIFEVDPGSIETEAPAPEPVNAAWSMAAPLSAHADVAETHMEAAAVAAPVEKPAAKADWSAPEWSGMKLGAQVRHEVAAPTLKDKLSLAPLHTRLMAGVVDTAVVVAAATFIWLTLALGMSHSLAPRVAEGMGAGAIVLVGLAYHAFFCFLGMPTLGMRYAGLSLCTFDEMVPTQEQLRRRFGALAVSMLPLGLGMAWSLFDEDHLAWHDRYSQTYLRHS